VPAAPAAQELRWFKGNTHTHTRNSDGDELPRRVIRWYLDHNYNFLVITDHDQVTDIRYLDTDANDDFLLIPGEELTDRLAERRMHVCAINLNKSLAPQHGDSVVATLQNNINVIRQAGAIPQINHPSWKWSFGADEISRLANVCLLEIFNMSLDVNNYPAGGHPGNESLWDRLLTGGMLIYGVASDDAHNFLGDFLSDRDHPGRGWIMVQAAELSPDAIVGALEEGRFYASNGVEMARVDTGGGRYALEIRPRGDAKYSTFFIGQGGRILKEEYGLQASYSFGGDEGYVRAKVVSSSGEFALTQPVLIKKR